MRAHHRHRSWPARPIRSGLYERCTGPAACRRSGERRQPSGVAGGEVATAPSGKPPPPRPAPRPVQEAESRRELGTRPWGSASATRRSSAVRTIFTAVFVVGQVAAERHVHPHDRHVGAPAGFRRAARPASARRSPAARASRSWRRPETGRSRRPELTYPFCEGPATRPMLAALSALRRRPGFRRCAARAHDASPAGRSTARRLPVRPRCTRPRRARWWRSPGWRGIGSRPRSAARAPGRSGADLKAERDGRGRA